MAFPWPVQVSSEICGMPASDRVLLSETFPLIVCSSLVPSHFHSVVCESLSPALAEYTHLLSDVFSDPALGCC